MIPFGQGLINYENPKPFIISPLYSYLSTAKGVNVRGALGCKAGTEQSERTQVNPSRFYIGIATPKIGSFYFPNFEEELYRQDYSRIIRVRLQILIY